MRFAFVAAVSGICWITASLLTRPPSLESLARFCRKVKPYPLGWGPVHQAYPDIEWSPHLGRSLAMWAIGLLGVFCLNFGSGHLLLGSTVFALILLSIAGSCLLLLLRYWRP